MNISKLLTALGIRPKDLEQANAALVPAKATLDSVNALFTNAGLNLEQMLEAGADSLKLHIDALGNADESLADALLEVERLEGELEQSKSDLLTASAVVAEIGLAPGGDLKAAFADHVKKAAAIELAKSWTGLDLVTQYAIAAALEA